MANFTVSDRSSKRFPDDFQLDTILPYVPTGDEAAFQTAIQRQLDILAEDAAKDDRPPPMRDQLRAARKDWRTETTGRLRSEADKFAADSGDAKAATDQVAAIAAGYAKGVPDIVIASVPTEAARFPGEFEVTPTAAYKPDAGEQAFLDRLKITRDYFATEVADDKNKKFSDGVVAERRAQRAITVEKLNRNAVDWKLGLKSDVATNNILVYRGGYKALCERLGHSLFSINVIRGKEAGELDPADQTAVVDLEITLAEGLPPPNDIASPDKQDLFVQVSNAVATVRTVCQQIRDQAQNSSQSDKIEAAKKRTRHLQDEYISKLAGIAGLGLEGPHTALAKLALTSLKSEFVAQEAGRIKNRYLRLLGYYAGGFAFAFMLFYVMIRINACPPPHASAAACTPSWWDIHKTFLLAAAAASVGTWVSFAIRRLDLPFEDLALLEEESLDPPFRILFVVALTLIVCLLFWTQAINIEIGNLRTTPDSFKITGSIAVVVGMFCGHPERALATAISGRAAAFVKGVAGGG